MGGGIVFKGSPITTSAVTGLGWQPIIKELFTKTVIMLL